MDSLKKYNIPFVGLSFGKHSYQYKIDDTFFKTFQYTELQNVNCDAEVIFDKKNTFFELHFKINGSATVICDVTNEPFEQNLENNLDLVVKFGDEYNDENDEILILPHEEYQINVAQFIYETILLAIPVKKVHPGIADGTLKSEVLEKLKEYQIQEKHNTDPRWEKLNQLLTPKKQ